MAKGKIVKGLRLMISSGLSLLNILQSGFFAFHFILNSHFYICCIQPFYNFAVLLLQLFSF